MSSDGHRCWQMLDWQMLDWQMLDWQMLDWQMLDWQMLDWQMLDWQMLEPTLHPIELAKSQLCSHRAGWLLAALLLSPDGSGEN